MKIGHPAAGIHEQASTAPAAGGRAAQDDSKAQGSAAVAGSAQIDLSSTASALIANNRGAAAEFDSAKVGRISQSIADGSFHVNAEAIADKLIANAQEVLGSVKR